MYNRAGCADICPSPQIYCVPSLLTYEFHLAGRVTDNIFTAPDPPRDLKPATFLELVTRTYRGYMQVLLLLHPFCHSITANACLQGKCAAHDVKAADFPKTPTGAAPAGSQDRSPMVVSQPVVSDMISWYPGSQKDNTCGRFEFKYDLLVHGLNEKLIIKGEVWALAQVGWKALGKIHLMVCLASVL